MKRSTTATAANSIKAVSKRVSSSTKSPKQPGRVFGTSSQFRGVQAGVKGDPRK